MNKIEEHYVDCADAVLHCIEALIDGDIERSNDLMSDKQKDIFSCAALDVATTIVVNFAKAAGLNPSLLWKEFVAMQTVSEDIKNYVKDVTPTIKV